MFHPTSKLAITFLALRTAYANQSPCPSLQSALQSCATEWPKPTGDLSSYISSFSSEHSGVFSGCSEFTSGMPSSISSPYQAWVSSVNDWSTSLESSISAAAPTCIGFVVNIVIATPRCSEDAGATQNSGTATSGSASSSTSSAATAGNTSVSGDSSSGANSVMEYPDANSLTSMVLALSIVTLAIAL